MHRPVFSQTAATARLDYCTKLLARLELEAAEVLDEVEEQVGAVRLLRELGDQLGYWV